jgi:hypothetical protein
MKNIVLLLFLGIAFSSCGIYHQNVVNVPMLQHKGQLQVASQVSFSGFEGQSCYTLTDKIAVLADYNTDRAGATRASKHYFGEVGVGLYKSAESDSNRKVRELFFLAGNGKTSQFEQNDTSSFFDQAFYNRFCLQANWGKSYKKRSWAISPRLTVIHYYNVNYEFLKLNNATNTNTNVFLGTAFTWRFKIVKHLLFSFQIDVTAPILPTVTEATSNIYDFSPINFSCGLVTDMNLFKRTSVK